MPPSFTCLPSSEIPTTTTTLWPRQDDPISRLNCNDLGALAPIVADTNALTALLDNPVCILFDITILASVYFINIIKFSYSACPCCQITLEKIESTMRDREELIH